MNNKEKKKKKGRFLSSVIPMKGDSPGEVFRKIVLIIAVCVFVVSAGMLARDFYESHRNKSMYQDLHSKIEVTAPDDNGDDTDVPKDSPLALNEINSDYVGWFSIGTTVSVPIVQSGDNDYYLHRNFYKENSKYGNPFLDCSNSVEKLDFNTVIYGHNMKDKQIFGKLIDMYSSTENFKANQIIDFNTVNGDTRWVVVGAFYSNALAKDDNGYVFPFNITDVPDGRRQSFIDELQKRFTYYSDISLTPDDKLLMLSTCAYEFKEERFVVVARLLHEGESVDNTSIIKNKNPRMPQAWYDKKAQTNPYSNDSNW